MYTGDPALKDKVTSTTDREVVAQSRSQRTYSWIMEDVIAEEDSTSTDNSDLETLDDETERTAPTSPTSNDSVFHPLPENIRASSRKYGVANGKVHFVDINEGKEAEKAKHFNQPKESLRIDHHKPKRKQILKNVSVYFNTGELVAIMGPSGCGKTTLLDLLTGRRKQGYRKVCVTDNIPHPGERVSCERSVMACKKVL